MQAADSRKLYRSSTRAHGLRNVLTRWAHATSGMRMSHVLCGHAPALRSLHVLTW